MQDIGQTDKSSQVKNALDTMAKELECIHGVVDRLAGKLDTVRVEREPPEGPATTGGGPVPQRSFVVRRLFELVDGLAGQRQRLETLAEEVEL